jgi:hypothetical protein
MRKEELTLDEALELVAGLQRTRNYPQTEDGVITFAQGLVRASRLLDGDGRAIIERCGDTSEFCPCDADLFTVAREIREERRREEEKASPDQLAQWRKEYGAPVPFEAPDWYPEAKKTIARREELWRLLKLRFPQAGRKGKDWPDWRTLAKHARELGYPEYADAWERAVR